MVITKWILINTQEHCGKGVLWTVTAKWILISTYYILDISSKVFSENYLTFCCFSENDLTFLGLFSYLPNFLTFPHFPC